MFTSNLRLQLKFDFPWLPREVPPVSIVVVAIMARHLGGVRVDASPKTPSQFPKNLDWEISTKSLNCDPAHISVDMRDKAGDLGV